MRKLVIVSIFLSLLIIVNAEYSFSELNGYYCDYDLYGYRSISVCDSMAALCGRDDITILNLEKSAEDRINNIISNSKANDIALTDEYIFVCTDDSLFAISLDSGTATSINMQKFYNIDIHSDDLITYGDSSINLYSSEYPFTMIDSLNVFSHAGIIQGDTIIIVGDEQVILVKYDNGNLNMINEFYMDSVFNPQPIGIYNNNIFFDYSYTDEYDLLHSEIWAFELINNSCLFKHKIHIQTSGDGVFSYSILIDSIITCISGIYTYDGLSILSYNDISGFHRDAFNNILANSYCYTLVDSSIYFINSEIGITKYAVRNSTICDLEEYYSMDISPHKIYFADNYYIDIEHCPYSSNQLVRVLIKDSIKVVEIETPNLLSEEFYYGAYPVNYGNDVLMFSCDQEDNIRYMPITIYDDSVHVTNSSKTVTNQEDNIIDYSWNNENIYLLGNNALYRCKSINHDSVIYSDCFSIHGHYVDANENYIVLGVDKTIYLLKPTSPITIADSLTLSGTADIGKLRIFRNEVRVIAGSNIISIEISAEDKLGIVDEFSMGFAYSEIALQENYLVVIKGAGVYLYTFTEPGYILTDSIIGEYYEYCNLSAGDSEILLYDSGYPVTYSLMRYEIYEVSGINHFKQVPEFDMNISYIDEGIEISISGSENKGILTIYDIQGREIRNCTGNRILLTGNTLNSGIYFALYQNANTSIKRKFIKY